jgi:hypothetical protein
MNFMHNRGWQISFLEEDCRTTPRLKLSFASPEKIMEIAARWGEDRMPEDKQALEYAVEKGRGALWLKLTSEEYAKLE